MGTSKDADLCGADAPRTRRLGPTQLRAQIWEPTVDPHARAIALERAISRTWRVSEKIAAMYLLGLTNRDLSGDPRAVGRRRGQQSLRCHRQQRRSLSQGDRLPRADDLPGTESFSFNRSQHVLAVDEFRPGVRRYNPRLVQQALYMFMSESNRRANTADCCYDAHPPCGRCPPALALHCSLNATPGAS